MKINNCSTVNNLTSNLNLLLFFSFLSFFLTPQSAVAQLDCDNCVSTGSWCIQTNPYAARFCTRKIADGQPNSQCRGNSRFVNACTGLSDGDKSELLPTSPFGLPDRCVTCLLTNGKWCITDVGETTGAHVHICLSKLVPDSFCTALRPGRHERYLTDVDCSTSRIGTARNNPNREFYGSYPDRCQPCIDLGKRSWCMADKNTTRLCIPSDASETLCYSGESYNSCNGLPSHLLTRKWLEGSPASSSTSSSTVSTSAATPSTTSSSTAASPATSSSTAASPAAVPSTMILFAVTSALFSAFIF